MQVVSAKWIANLDCRSPQKRPLNRSGVMDGSRPVRGRQVLPADLRILATIPTAEYAKVLRNGHRPNIVVPTGQAVAVESFGRLFFPLGTPVYYVIEISV